MIQHRGRHAGHRRFAMAAAIFAALGLTACGRSSVVDQDSTPTAPSHALHCAPEPGSDSASLAANRQLACEAQARGPAA